MTQAIVEFENVGFAFDQKRVLDGVGFEVRAGEALVLLGRSGSGKSTALRLVNRLLVPDSGEVRVEGRATTEWSATRLRRRIGYVIQELGLFPHLTVSENVAVVPRLLEWPPERVRARTEELLDLVGLPAAEFGERYPRALSGGQKQRVAVARGLGADPAILLCDEPFGALDPITRGELQREFRRLSRHLEKTVLFVTHDVREARYLADRVGLLADGRLRFLGSVAEFEASVDPAVRDFRDATILDRA